MNVSGMDGILMNCVVDTIVVEHNCVLRLMEMAKPSSGLSTNVDKPLTFR